MTSKQLNRIYNKEKAKYLVSIQNDDGSYTCKGCDCDFFTIEIHHIIKRSQSLYYFADKRNFIHLCRNCHRLAEGTKENQIKLNCYQEMKKKKRILIDIYNRLKPFEQTLIFKYGK